MQALHRFWRMMLFLKSYQFSCRILHCVFRWTCTWFGWDTPWSSCWHSQSPELKMVSYWLYWKIACLLLGQLVETRCEPRGLCIGWHFAVAHVCPGYYLWPSGNLLGKGTGKMLCQCHVRLVKGRLYGLVSDWVRNSTCRIWKAKVSMMQLCALLGHFFILSCIDSLINMQKKKMVTKLNLQGLHSQ